jgi:hypothetical protein
LTQPVEPVVGAAGGGAVGCSFDVDALAVVALVRLGGWRRSGAGTAFVSRDGASRFPCSVFAPREASPSGGEPDIDWTRVLRCRFGTSLSVGSSRSVERSASVASDLVGALVTGGTRVTLAASGLGLLGPLRFARSSTSPSDAWAGLAAAPLAASPDRGSRSGGLAADTPLDRRGGSEALARPDPPRSSSALAPWISSIRFR